MSMPLTGFKLNLENLENMENRPFFERSGKNWNIQGKFCNFCPSQGKVSGNKVFSPYAILMNTLHGCLQSGYAICHQ